MKFVFNLITIVLAVSFVDAQTDLKNSSDYPLLERLPNYHIVKYVENEFDMYPFYYDRKKNMHEGKKYIIEYKHNNWNEKEFKFPTRLQVLRNYSNAIKNSGGKILFEKSNGEKGYYSFKTKDGKVIWVEVKSLVTTSGKKYKLTIIEEGKMRQDVKINADLIKNALELDGRIAIYGIYFDTGKSIVKEDSEPALIEIAKFLKDNPDINCWVVGHTDSNGSFQINSQLSLKRAKAVRDLLIKKYNVAEHRLFAEGVGPLAPVASNSNADGQQKNRRVELVKK